MLLQYGFGFRLSDSRTARPHEQVKGSGEAAHNLDAIPTDSFHGFYSQTP